MVGPILATVLRYTETDEGSARPVGFTSFDPDVCLALRLRAPKALPVLFLTVGLPIQHPDARRNSLEAAFAFAAASELQVSAFYYRTCLLCGTSSRHAQL